MHGTRTARRDRRRMVALGACVLWLAGVEVLPNVHLALHADDHTHTADGMIVRVAAHRDHDHDHPHAAGAHEHDHDHPHAARARAEHRAATAELAIDLPATGHDAAGVAHHALALHRPPPPRLEPLPIRAQPLPLADGPDLRIDHAPRARPVARGPPARA